MFRHPASAVGSYSSGPQAAGTVGTNSTVGCYRADVSPSSDCAQLSVPYLRSRAAVPLGLRPRGREVADVEVDVGRADLEAV